MGRSYAGVLAIVAFVTVALRGLKSGASPAALLLGALAALWLFAAIGYAAGLLAGWMLEQSLRERLTNELNRGPAPAGSGQAEATN